ncbi:DeoR/GlpR family DNA-binding transcription regulator [Cytobacillus sp. Hm23]
MFQEERMLAILNYLKIHKKISVDEICQQYNVSRDTARRDLVKLEEKQAILRTRGGAILPTLNNEIKSYNDRLRLLSKEKEAIGRVAATLVNDGDIIIMDESTTVQACAEFLQATDCTVVTNSISHSLILSNNPGADIYLLGGQLNKEHRFLYGSSTVEKLSHYNVDKAFIGVTGISNRGLTIAHEEDGFVKKKMIEQATEVIVLADSTKFHTQAFFTFAALSQIDVVITDQQIDDSLMSVLHDYDVEVLVASSQMLNI